LSRTRLVWPATVVAPWLALASPLCALQPPPGQTWWSLEGPAIRYSSDAPRRLPEIARDLEAGRSALLSLVGAPDHVPALDTEVLIFRTGTELLRYHRTMEGTPPETGVASGTDRRGHIVAFAADQAKHDLASVRALLLGDLVDGLLPAAPAWVVVGLRQTLAGLELDKTGTRLEQRTSAAAEGPTGEWPAPQALVVGTPEEITPFAEAMVRYSVQPRSNRSAQFRRYLVLLRAGAPHELAFDEAFGLGFAYFVGEVRGAVRSGHDLDLELPAGTARGQPTARELTTDERNVLLGDLILRTSEWDTVAADSHYETVPAGSASRGSALRGSATARLIDRRRDDAFELFDQSHLAEPGDPETCLLHSWALLETFRQKAGTRHAWEPALPPEVARARELAVLGLVASPKQPHLLHALGAADLFGGDRQASGLEALERAHGLLPNNTEILADLALALAHAGQTERAHELVRRLTDRGPELAATRTARLVTDADVALATSRLQRGQKAEARAILRSTRAATTDASAQAHIDAFLAQLDELQSAHDRDDWIRRFNETYPRAQALAAGGRLAESRALLEPFLDPEAPPEVKETAAGLIDRIDRAAADR
jgi:hypothetical protein